jgi:hypothetical protein
LQFVHDGLNCTSYDVAGLKLALEALTASLTEEEELPQPGLEYDADGIFFLSFGRVSLILSLLISPCH